MSRVASWIGVGLVIMLAFGVGVNTASASIVGMPDGLDPFVLGFDETGNGVLATYDALGNLGPYLSHPGVQILPGGGIEYQLPERVVPGFVEVLEPGTGRLSDLLYFPVTPIGSFSTMRFYSDLADEAPNWADVSQWPSEYVYNNGVLPVEQVTEVRLGPGVEVFVWGPPAGSGGSLNTYIGFSEGTIPEPATIIVWSILGGLGIVFGWRRRRQAA